MPACVKQRFCWLSLLTASALIALAAPAVAAPPIPAAPSPPQLAVALHYQTDPELHGCASEAEFRSLIAQQLGYDPFRSDATHNVSAELHVANTGIAGRISWTGTDGNSEGERRLASAGLDCAEFARGLAFAIVVQIQLLNSVNLVPADSAPSVPKPALRPVPLPVAPSRASQPLIEKRWRLLLGAGPSVDAGAAPSIAEGAHLFGRLRSAAFSLELGPEATFPVTFRNSDGFGFTVATLAAALVPCGWHGRWALCAVGMLGRLAVHGVGIDAPRSPASLIGKAGLRLGFEQPLSAFWALGVHLDALLNLTPRTVLVNEEPVWTSPRFGFTLGIDLALLLP